MTKRTSTLDGSRIGLHRRSVFPVLAAMVLWVGTAAAGEYQQIDLLRTGKAAYTNVTITGKGKANIFIRHDGGVANIKVQELDPEVQRTLGYVVASAARKSALGGAGSRMTRVTNQLMDSIPFKNLRLSGSSSFLAGTSNVHLNSSIVIGVLTGALLGYLFFCCCCALICRKAGSEPGALVWLPILQLFPLLRAAGMSGWWFLAFGVPLLNLVAHILWSVNIVKARDKSVWWALLMILPFTNLLAFLYLAFSRTAAATSAPHFRAADLRAADLQPA